MRSWAPTQAKSRKRPTTPGQDKRPRTGCLKAGMFCWVSASTPPLPDTLPSFMGFLILSASRCWAMEPWKVRRRRMLRRALCRRKASSTPLNLDPLKCEQQVLRNCSHGARRASQQNARQMLAGLLSVGRAIGKKLGEYSNNARIKLTGAPLDNFLGVGGKHRPIWANK